jgi:hypothetical protein
MDGRPHRVLLADRALGLRDAKLGLHDRSFFLTNQA